LQLVRLKKFKTHEIGFETTCFYFLLRWKGLEKNHVKKITIIFVRFYVFSFYFYKNKKSHALKFQQLDLSVGKNKNKKHKWIFTCMLCEVD